MTLLNQLSSSPARAINHDTGYLHSIETGSAVDGPGIRMVVFTSGCLLRCQFCHNPDTWAPAAGREISVSDLVAEIAKYADFLKTCNGGITFSGGEPPFQLPFLEQVIRRIKSELGLHVAIQTAAFLGDRVSDDLLNLVDLWMVDFKSADPDQYRIVTHVDQPNMLRFVHRLAHHNRPMWISYVLVPNLTDHHDHIDRLGQLLVPFKNLERMEIRPFHQLGKAKWQALGVTYPLEYTLSPTPELIARVVGQLTAYDLPVVVA